MKLAVYQGQGVATDCALAMAVIERICAAAAIAGADAVLFPELFCCGYNIGERVHELAEELDGPLVQRLRALASNHELALVTGFAERTGNGTANSAIAISGDGSILAIHRKYQLCGPGEKRLFVAGNEVRTFALCGRQAAMLICYDAEFPEFVRRCVRAGADLVLVPTACMMPHIETPISIIRARCLENGITMAYSNYSGSEGDLTYVGRSGIVGEDGTDLARAGIRGEVLLIADLEAGRASAVIKSTQIAELRE